MDNIHKYELAIPLDTMAEEAPEIGMEVEVGGDVSGRVAEAWAVGQRNGTDVAEGDATYHNNAKYYAGEADGSAEDAEAWAIGQRDGTNVPTTDETYHNNAKYYAGLAQQNQNQTARDVTATQEAAAAARGAVDDAEAAQHAAEAAAQEAADTVVAAQGPGILYVGDDGVPYVLD